MEPAPAPSPQPALFEELDDQRGADLGLFELKKMSCLRHEVVVEENSFHRWQVLLTIGCE